LNIKSKVYHLLLKHNKYKNNNNIEMNNLYKRNQKVSQRESAS
jgi:hypothetical protein